MDEEKKERKNITRSNWEFVSQINIRNQDLEILGEYINSKTKIKARCKVCGKIIEKLPSYFLSGRIHSSQKDNCVKFGHSIPCDFRTFKSMMDEIFKIYKKLHKRYSFKSYYKGRDMPIILECLCCGKEFEAYPSEMLKKKIACPNCKNINPAKNNKQSSNGLRVRKKCPKPYNIMASCLIKRLNLCSPCFVNEKVYYTKNEFNSAISPNILLLETFDGTQKVIKCKCKKCGNIWDESTSKLLNGKNCPVCHYSKGEMKVATCLEKNNISYVKDKTFSDCKNIGLLRFDFYLPEYNAVIEYDGEQHFHPVNFSGKNDNYIADFYQLKNRDNIKNRYCKNNHIPLLRINYKNENVEDMIIAFLKKCGRNN